MTIALSFETRGIYKLGLVMVSIQRKTEIVYLACCVCCNLHRDRFVKAQSMVCDLEFCFCIGFDWLKESAWDVLVELVEMKRKVTTKYVYQLTQTCSS